LTVGELVLLYLEYARTYYRKNGRQTSEVACVESACRYLMPHRTRRAADFWPLALEAARLEMVAADLARPTMNAYVGRIRGMFGSARRARPRGAASPTRRFRRSAGRRGRRSG